MTPTPGRIVLYNPSREDRQARSLEPGVLPAMVIRSNDDGSVNLKVFNDCGIDFTVKHSFEGGTEGRWFWPQSIAGGVAR